MSVRWSRCPIDLILMEEVKARIGAEIGITIRKHIRRTTMTQSITDTSYVFGHSEEEIRRLMRQSRLGNPCTRRFLEQAGISPGLKALGVGGGPGDGALVLADRLRPGGAVVGGRLGPA